MQERVARITIGTPHSRSQRRENPRKDQVGSEHLSRAAIELQKPLLPTPIEVRVYRADGAKSFQDMIPQSQSWAFSYKKAMVEALSLSAGSLSNYSFRSEAWLLQPRISNQLINFRIKPTRFLALQHVCYRI